MYIKEKEILTAHISKHNSAREKKVITLMIPNKEREGWHYLAVTKFSALLYRIVLILLEQKISLILMYVKTYVKIKIFVKL